MDGLSVEIVTRDGNTLLPAEENERSSIKLVSATSIDASMGFMLIYNYLSLDYFGL
jgi:hypothetical protein